MILLSLGAVTLSQLISDTGAAGRHRPDVCVSQPRISAPDVLWRPYDTASDDSDETSDT